MDLYYNLTRQCRVNENNSVLSGRPVLYLGAKPELTLHFFLGEPGTDPAAADLSGAVTWRAAVDADWTGSTDPMCRTLSEDIDAAAAATGVIKLPINTCTARFAEALGNRQSVEAYFELRGFDSSGAAAVVVIFPVLCHNAVDADGGAALDDVPSDVPTKSWVIAVLSGYTAATASIAELTARVSGAERAIEGAAAGIADLADSVSDLVPVSAFEVYAHDEDIPAGEYCAALCKTGDVVSQTIPACMKEHFIIGTEHPAAEQDVVIEWGDGSTERLADVPAAHISGANRHLFHEYATPGKYIVRITGTTYAYFRPGDDQEGHCENGISQPGYGNLICRIFDYDLPVASHLTNFSGACRVSPRLLYVDFSRSRVKQQARHCDSLCYQSRNLLSAVGFYDHRIVRISNAFSGCTNLVTTDFVLPAVMSGDGPNMLFNGCKNLVGDIASFFPTSFAPGAPARAVAMFYRCVKLTGTVPADKLWNSPYEWTLGAAGQLPFLFCSAAIRAQVPVSWGGTASDDIIKPKLTGLEILHPVSVTGGIVALDAAHNAYRVAPTEATSIAIDASGLGNVTGAQFHLIVDMSAGVQAVTFPSNFSFVGGTSPVMSTKGYHFIRTTYSALGDGGFFGEYMGVTAPPKDLTRGVWFWVDGELDTSVYDGQEYLASADFSGGTMHINFGSVVGNLSCNEAYDGDWLGKDALCVIAGTVGSLTIADAGDGRGEYDLRAVVSGGTVGSVRLEASQCFTQLQIEDGFVVSSGIYNTYQVALASIHITGGTAGSVGVYRGYGDVIVSGGMVGEITGNDGTDGENITVSDGIVGRIDRYNPPMVYVSIIGGTVAEITNSFSMDQGSTLSITGGTVLSVTQTAYIGTVVVGGSAVVGVVTLGDDQNAEEYGSDLVVSGNAIVQRVVSEFTVYPDYEAQQVKTGITISGGTVGITPHLKAQIDAGGVTLNVTGGTVVYLDN